MIAEATMADVVNWKLRGVHPIVHNLQNYRNRASFFSHVMHFLTRFLDRPLSKTTNEIKQAFYALAQPIDLNLVYGNQAYTVCRYLRGQIAEMPPCYGAFIQETGLWIQEILDNLDAFGPTNRFPKITRPRIMALIGGLVHGAELAVF